MSTSATVRLGERQSPVDIPPSAPVHRAGLELRYGPIPLVMGDNVTAIQVDNTSAAEAILDGQAYELLQFHLHCPAEHTFGGTRAPLGLHLVHRSAAGELAVVGVTFVEGRENPVLQAVISVLEGRGEAPTQELIDLRALIPVDLAHVAYDGSLTTPPYSESVRWRMLVRPNTLSTAQLDRLRAARPPNARPVQPMNERRFL